MHLAGRYFGFHLHYMRIGADRVDLKDPVPPTVPPGYDVRLVTRQELLACVDRLPGLSREFLDDAFSGNDECSAAFYGDEMVAFAFTKRSRAVVTDQIDVVVPAGFRYGYKSWTHPDHRRQHLSRTMTYVKETQAGRPFQERGISYIATHNYASLLRSHTSPSARSIPMGFVGWITIGGRQIPFNSRKAKWIGCIFVRKEDHRVRQICW
jgi:hypothetical protein